MLQEESWLVYERREVVRDLHDPHPDGAKK